MILILLIVSNAAGYSPVVDCNSANILLLKLDVPGLVDSPLTPDYNCISCYYILFRFLFNYSDGFLVFTTVVCALYYYCYY